MVLKINIFFTSREHIIHKTSFKKEYDKDVYTLCYSFMLLINVKGILVWQTGIGPLHQDGSYACLKKRVGFWSRGHDSHLNLIPDEGTSHFGTEMVTPINV